MYQTYAIARGLVAITGASSGIGASIAKAIARQNYPVALLARRVERLEQLAEEIRASGGRAYPVPINLASPSAVESAPARLKDLGYPLRILINSAGLAWYGFGEAMPWRKAREMIAVNLSAVAQLTLAILPEMKGRNQGHIINIGSIAGSIPSQGVALYSATKSFLDTFSTALSRELRGTNVHMSVLRVGAVATPFYQNVANQPESRKIPVEWLAIQPEKVAQSVIRLIKKPRRVVYVPGWLRIIPWVELSFGWLMDRIGPALLRIHSSRS
jgi:short-subunit dehydrogenase